MASEVYWIAADTPNRIGIMARPRAGDWLEDEVAHWASEGVEVVLSLLEDAEVEELGLNDEPELCRAAGIDFRSFPIPDRGTPANTSAALTTLREILSTGKPVAIHCRAGIGRSALMAALLLRLSGLNTESAFAAISAARRLQVPDTEHQREWVDGAIGERR